MQNHEQQGLLIVLLLERKDGLRGPGRRFFQEMGRIGV